MSALPVGDPSPGLGMGLLKGWRDIRGRGRAEQGRGFLRRSPRSPRKPRDSHGSALSPEGRQDSPPIQGHPAALREGRGSKVSSLLGREMGDGCWLLECVFPGGQGQHPLCPPGPCSGPETAVWLVTGGRLGTAALSALVPGLTLSPPTPLFAPG